MSWQDILNGIGGAADLGTQYLLAKELADKQREAGQAAYTQATGLGTELAGAAAGTFKPFTVSTGLGPSLMVGQEGITFAPVTPGSYEAQQQMDAKALARSGAQQLAAVTGPGKLQEEQARIQGMLLGPSIGAAQQDIYSQLQALRAPEQERQRLALEERLFSQGREGLRTAMYGGAPEQLAFEKAIQEQQAADALQARQQALAEQQQSAGLIGQALGLAGQQQALQAELGLGAAQAAFLPQQQALSMLAGGVPFSELATRAGLQGVVAQGELGGAGLEALLGGQANATAIEQEYLKTLREAIFGGGPNSQFTSGLGMLGSVAGSLFGYNPTTGFWNAPSMIPSDMRLKANIQKVGQVNSDIGLYTWDWTDKGKELAGNLPTWGVLAQEVMQTLPEAVAKGVDGFFRVDYSKVLQAGN